MPQRPESVVSIANRKVSFEKALRWADIRTGVRDRGMKTVCPLCRESGALRVYPDHGYCFSERKYLSTVGLLAELWKLDYTHAAVKALDLIGYVPADYAHLWEDAQRDPEPAREELAAALRIWCEARCTDWGTRQYEPAVAGKLARCLGLLPKVHTEDQCLRWLEVCKVAMSRVLTAD